MPNRKSILALFLFGALLVPGVRSASAADGISGECRQNETRAADWLGGESDSKLLPGLTPAPDFKVMYTCGTCGEASCYGKTVQSSCTSSSGLPGVCLALFSGSQPARCPYGGYQCACLD